MRYLWLLFPLVFLLTACPSGQVQPPVVKPSTFVIDPALQPIQSTIPGLDGIGSRNLESARSASGAKMDFVQNELVLITDDQAALEAFLKRWSGTELALFKPADYGLDKLKPYHLVRIDPSKADASRLAGNTHALNPKVRDDIALSSQSALKLLSVAVDEALNHQLSASLNFVFSGNDIRHGSTLEDSSYAPKGAFGWTYMLKSSTPGSQNFGVTSAWRLLEGAGKFSNKVKIAILDGGFTNNKDLPPGAVIYPPKAWNLENPVSCSSGNKCEWHGNNVADAAFAQPDNSFGVAGPAGPVAVPILLQRGGTVDLMSLISGTGYAVAEGAKIINMSFGVPISSAIILLDPVTYALGVSAIDALTDGLRSKGVLVFASAGNDGKDVDNSTNFGETTVWVPCESTGVICVGGLQADKNTRDPGSNYGSADEADSVNLFGPYTLNVGPDPKQMSAHSVNGTSFASPFVAGVAGLVWAANPALSADQVESILYSTADPTSDPNPSVLHQEKIVNAYKAVIAALGGTPTFLPDRFEPNQTIGTAAAIQPGETKDVSIHTKTDPDYYSLNLAEVSGVVVHHEFVADLGTIKFEGLESTSGCGYVIQNSKIPQTAVYLAKGSVALHFSGSDVNFYDFVTNVIPYGTAADAFEPNNTPATATNLGNGGSAKALTIHTAADIDYFKITNPGTGGGQGYLGFLFRVDGGSNVPIRLRLLDLSGNPILQNGNPVVSTTAADCSSFATLSIPVGSFVVEAAGLPTGDYYLSSGDAKAAPKGLVDKVSTIIKININTGDPVNAVLNAEVQKIFGLDRNVDLPIMSLKGEGTHLTLYNSEGTKIGEGTAATDPTGAPLETFNLSGVAPGQEYFAEVTRKAGVPAGLALPFTLGLAPN